MLWTWANPGWLRSGPTLVDLNGDGKLDIIQTSYNGHTYALNCDGELLWDYCNAVDECAIGAAAAAPLKPGESPSVVVDTTKTLLVLDNQGNVRWKKEGRRQYDRSSKSVSLADLTENGNQDIIAASDNGEITAFDADGAELWKYTTAQRRNRGLAMTTPVIVDGPKGKQVVFGTDDGFIYCLDKEGQLLWKLDSGIGDGLPGVPPTALRCCSAVLEPGGEPRIISGTRGLRVFDLDGKMVWEKPGGGMPVIADLYHDGSRQILRGVGKACRALDSKGETIWDYPFEGMGNFMTSPIVAADIDDDGQCEILIGARDTHLHVIGADGKLRWRCKTLDEITATVAVADINNDGVMEIVFGSRDGLLRCLAGGKAPENPITATTYLANASRTGEYC